MHLKLSFCFTGLATTLGTGIYTLITVAAHDHAGPSVVLSILAAAVTACLGGNKNNYFITGNLSTWIKYFDYKIKMYLF